MSHGIYEGIRENQHRTNAWEAPKTVQYYKAAKKESNWTKDSCPSPNAKMISSILISQMINENKSKENKAAFSMQSVITQSDAYHMNQSLANHSSVNINRAFILLPRRLGIQITSDDSAFGTDIDSKGIRQCHKQKKGFASITITARQVVPPCNRKTQVDTSSCLKCQEIKSPMSTLPASKGTGLHQPCRPLDTQGCCKNKNATKIRISEPCPQLSKSGWISNTENKENGLVSPGNNHNKEAPISFTSSLHLSISQHNPNAIYYVDKSLSVPVNQPQTRNQKIHRSVVSFSLNCSSPSLTPDGVDGLANGELITEVLKTKLPEHGKPLLEAIWNADLKESYSLRRQTLEKESLGTECLWKDTSPLTLSVADSPQGLDHLRSTKSNDGNSSDTHTLLSSHMPHWTYDEGEQLFSGSNRKQCARDTYHETTSASFLKQSSKEECMLEGRISSKDKHLPKGTLESKESQAQSFARAKKYISECGCHIKAPSNTTQDENANLRTDPFPKGDYIFYGSAIKLKEHKESEKNETVGRVRTSTAHEPDVPHEKHEAFQQPKVCSEPEKIPANPLTLREALEVHKPHFICRSQERLKKLQQIIQLRKAQQGDGSLKKQGADTSHKLSSSSITSKKKQYTIPHPLSDNLFKPKERFISEKEMHMRSKRIYNNLPEVKKKQEEKQKRVILQSNRMRVEVFKKQLLDQLLQRNTE
ncbi:(E2-independent) E3 ubiquitin-conjugating enzyme FATS isoform X2 [Sceloporus undulatus]|uniref:(E2-independent) E3 ubiquitin-conjugating enzyme FATS isoform X2 n=1 Tax=Sceloporus undulatus TaxID=8520 RepID=UPI001C4D7068|nr:(E2-independent) E3 ubiquitin-conjugating enzyme FATS isoform X2 [Sceloporus undulatus]